MATIVGSSAGTKQAQLSAKINEAVEAGEKFIEVFYDALDKRRQVLVKKTQPFLEHIVKITFRSWRACIRTPLW